MSNDREEVNGTYRPTWWEKLLFYLLLIAMAIFGIVCAAILLTA